MCVIFITFMYSYSYIISGNTILNIRDIDDVLLCYIPHSSL